jgi:xylulokinase
VALLAQVGSGGFSSVPEACDATIRAAETTAVDARAKRFYDEGFAVYRQLYQDLRHSFRKISALVDYHW